jgi:hypothetical protein
VILDHASKITIQHHVARFQARFDARDQSQCHKFVPVKEFVLVVPVDFTESIICLDWAAREHRGGYRAYASDEIRSEGRESLTLNDDVVEAMTLFAQNSESEASKPNPRRRFCHDFQ